MSLQEFEEYVSIKPIISLFKLSCIDSIISGRPSILNMRDRAKWDAWKAVEAKSKEEATSDYIIKICEFDPDAGSNQERAEVEAALVRSYENRFEVEQNSELLWRMQVNLSMKKKEHVNEILPYLLLRFLAFTKAKKSGRNGARFSFGEVNYQLWKLFDQSVEAFTV